MADKDNMSVEEMLAACRKVDGDGAGEAAAPEPAAEEPAPDPTPKKEKAKPAGGAAKSPGEMSVADMLAAARASDAGGGGGGDDEEETPATEEKAAPAASGKKPGEMSVAEMLAAARGEKAAPKKEKAAPKAKASAAKASPKKAAAPAKEDKKHTGPRDTGSILAAARKDAKAGPMSKAEAAGKGVDVSPKGKKPKLEAPPMPDRPAYATPTPARARGEDETRRGFFSVFLGSALAIGFTSLGIVGTLWTLGFARFMFPNILTEPPTKFKVGPPGNFAPGSVETKYKAQFGVWVVNALYQGAQIVFALKSVCTHLGCTPNWLEAEQKFKCPCHGSGFYKDGINFEGPAPRPLERYAIKVAADGQLEIDKSATFQEEKGQWKDGASYVEV